MTNKKIRHIALISIFIPVILLSGTPLSAQNNHYDFERIPLPASLAKRNVTCILQDHKGFMWIGTESGLCRYDGYNFKIFKGTLNKTDDFSINHITAIVEDAEKQLWIGAEIGLSCLDPASEKIEIYSIDSFSSSSNTIRSLKIDHTGTLWVGTNNGVYRFDKKEGTFTRYALTLLSNENVEAMYVDRKGALWVGYENYLYEYQLSTDSFISHKLSDNPDALVDLIYEKNDGNLLIALRDHVLLEYDREMDSVVTFDEAQVSGVSSIYEDQSGNMWIGHGEGIHIFNREATTVEVLRHVSNDDRSLTDNWVETIFEDRSGMIWVGTVGGGLNLHNPFKTRFTHYRNDPNDPHTLSDNIVRSIYEDHKGYIWVGTQRAGLNKLDRKRNIFSPIDLMVVQPPTQHIWSVIEDNFGVIWIATTSNGIVEHNPTSGSFELHEVNHELWKLYEDKQFNIWVGTDSGLGLLNRDTKKFSWYKHNDSDPTSITDGDIFSVLEDSYGDLWVGTWYGLNRLENTESGRIGGKFVRYHHSPSDANSLTDNKISVIHEDQFKNLWIGTYGGGLNKYSRETDDFTYYAGLPNETIYGILDDEDGNLWISTNLGISKYNPKTSTAITYGIDDQLQGYEFNTGAYFKSKSGEMFFGGMNGMNTFFPQDIKNIMTPPQIVILDLKVFNESIPLGELGDGRIILNKNISYTSEITLEHDENVISLEFSALNFADSKSNQYAYKLEGIDEGWNFLGYNRAIFLPQLNPGLYEITMKASNSDGVWNESGIKFFITILPAWWQTWWAKSCYALAAFALVIGIVHVRTTNLKKHQIELEQTVIERTATVIEQKEKIESALNQLGQTQAQLVLSEKMASLGQLTAGIAHEINNPVSFLQTSSFALENDLNDITYIVEKYREFLKKSNIDISEITDFEKIIDYDILLESIKQEINDIKEGTKRTTEIVRGLRQFSHEDNVEMELADIHDGIDSSLNLMSIRLKEGVILIKNYDQSINEITCHIGQLNQLFLNLLTNALDAMSDKGELEITTEKNVKGITISIKDDGQGIPEDIKNNIFDPFFTTKKVGEGTGLGLSICHGIIERHGGTIEVKSEVGKGSEFIISLPRNV